jgi:glutamate dehydrogenase/leucine dehydrogenase
MVSYFELVQNLTNYYREEEEVDKKLHIKITHSTTDVYKMAVKIKTHLRNAAYIIAMKRVLDAMNDR